MNNLVCECCGKSHPLNITWDKYDKLDELGYVATADCKDVRRRIQEGHCKIVYEDDFHLAYIHIDNIRSQSLLHYVLGLLDKILIED
jgi:hypothetical protein